MDAPYLFKRHEQSFLGVNPSCAFFALLAACFPYEQRSVLTIAVATAVFLFTLKRSKYYDISLAATLQLLRIFLGFLVRFYYYSDLERTPHHDSRKRIPIEDTEDPLDWLSIAYASMLIILKLLTLASIVCSILQRRRGNHTRSYFYLATTLLGTMLVCLTSPATDESPTCIGAGIVYCTEYRSTGQQILDFVTFLGMRLLISLTVTIVTFAIGVILQHKHIIKERVLDGYISLHVRYEDRTQFMGLFPRFLKSWAWSQLKTFATYLANAIVHLILSHTEEGGRLVHDAFHYQTTRERCTTLQAERDAFEYQYSETSERLGDTKVLLFDLRRNLNISNNTRDEYDASRKQQRQQLIDQESRYAKVIRRMETRHFRTENEENKQLKDALFARDEKHRREKSALEQRSQDIRERTAASESIYNRQTATLARKEAELAEAKKLMNEWKGRYQRQAEELKTKNELAKELQKKCNQHDFLVLQKDKQIQRLESAAKSASPLPSTEAAGQQGQHSAVRQPASAPTTGRMLREEDTQEERTLFTGATETVSGRTGSIKKVVPGAPRPIMQTRASRPPRLDLSATFRKHAAQQTE